MMRKWGINQSMFDQLTACISTTADSLQYYGRLWKQLFFHLQQLAELGRGNMLCHCEHGFHRSPTGAALVFYALHNCQPGCDGPCSVNWFLDELSLERIKSTR